MVSRSSFPKYFAIGHATVRWSTESTLNLSMNFFLFLCTTKSLATGGVYLLGGTNAGKTSLFNSLIDSDLCHIHALDCVQRATVSNLPGSTRNQVKVCSCSLGKVFRRAFRNNVECSQFPDSTANRQKSFLENRTFETARREKNRI